MRRKSESIKMKTLKRFVSILVLFIYWKKSEVYCQDAASSERGGVPGRPTWQFSAQHWKLLELRNLAELGGHKSPETITTYDSELCYTDECLDAAREYLTSTNFSANPCEPTKWLNFVCNRRTQYPILDRLNQFQDLMLLSERNTIAIMRSPNLTEPALRKAQNYFRHCVTWYSKNDPSKVDEIVRHLATHGTWPLLTGADNPGPAFDWRELYSTVQKVLQKEVQPYLFEVSSVGHNKTHVPTLFEGHKSFGMMKDEIIEIIRTLSKGSRMLTITDSQLLEMEDFFANLNRAQFDRSRSKAVSVQKLQDFYNSQAGVPKFDFTSFLEMVYNGSGVAITPNLVLGTDLQGLQRHVRVIEEASPRVLANVLFLQLAVALLSQTSDLTNDPFIFPSLTSYQVQRKYDPEAACAAEVQTKFDYALSHEYARRYFEEENSREVKKLFEDLRKGYIWLIRQTGWIAPHTKSFLIDKANSIQAFIAYEQWTKDSGRMNEYYNDMRISPERNDFINGYVTGSEFVRAREMGLLLKGSPNVFSYPAGNAYAGSISPVYSPDFNQIKIPAGAIQKPVFSHKNPGYMNYAALGSAIAHELGHQFDTIGIHTSKDGRKGDYWDWLSYELYNKWKQILIEDYNSNGFRVEEPRGNYATTCQDHAKVIDEDIADLTGLYIAYLGYQQYRRDLRNSWKQEPILPGLKDFTPDQLFWMKYGNSWCEHVQTLLVDPKATTKGHSPGNTRASLPIKRFRYWARAFKCPNPNIQDFY